MATSKYLQKLAWCGELDSMRDPIVTAITCLLSHNPVSPSQNVVGLTSDEIKTTLFDEFGYAAGDVEAALTLFTAKHLFAIKQPQTTAEPVYIISPTAVYRAPMDYSILIYFDPRTTFPRLGSNIPTQYYPRGVNANKGTVSTFGTYRYWSQT